MKILNLRYPFFLLAFIAIFIIGCGEEKPKKKPEKKIDYIKIEKKKLEEELNASTVLPYYKGTKLIFRTTLSITSDEDELQKRAQQFKALTQFATKASSGELPDLSLLYNNFSLDELKQLPAALTNYIANFDSLDEDKYPTLLEGIEESLDAPVKNKKWLNWNNDKEHLIMAMLLDAFSVPPALELYEASVITGEGLGDTELHPLGLYYKGIILLQNGYNHLAVQAFNEGINFIGTEAFKWTGTFSYALFKNSAINNERQLQTLGILLRGYARIQMDEPKHRKLGFEDLEQYVEHTQSDHDVNGITLLTEAILALKKDDIKLSQNKLDQATSISGSSWAEKALIAEIMSSSSDNAILSENLVNNLIVGAIFSDYLISLVINSSWYDYLRATTAGETLIGLPKFLEREYERLKPMIDLF